MENREPLGKRVGRFLAWMGGLFAITMGVIVTQRLSEDALALMLGLVFGVGLMMPLLALVIFVWRREAARGQAQRHTTGAQSPVVVVTPPAMPSGYNQPWSTLRQDTASMWQMAPAKRDFTIVGGEE